MKTTIGGDRIGSGNRQEVSLKNFKRSNHDLGTKWRSSMAAGTVVPFMNLIGLPGDSFDIELAADVVTLPTVGPLFGSFKMQLDVFQIPLRIYNSLLHMNKRGIGNDMSKVLLPQLRIRAQKGGNVTAEQELQDDIQVNPSALIKYLGISGIGNISNQADGLYTREFNATPLLGYWDVIKNFYVNNQEERAFVIHTDNDSIGQGQQVTAMSVYPDGVNYNGNILGNPIALTGITNDYRLEIAFEDGAEEPDPVKFRFLVDAGDTSLSTHFGSIVWDTTIPTIPRLICTQIASTANQTQEGYDPYYGEPTGGWNLQPKLVEFPLSNLDDTRLAILRHTPDTTPYIINETNLTPYNVNALYTGPANDRTFSCRYPQEGLAVKTYQSDLFNTWINTEWLDGANGVNAVTAVDTTGNSFTIDALNLAKKIYIMLNRVAISGGTFDDWLDAVYEHERPRSMEEPLYHGSLIKEIAFEEVISNAATDVGGVQQPLGELGGRGRLTDKHKGGKMKIKIHEHSIIMGLVSITPRVEYSNGNDWSSNLKTMNDFHKPDLDAIGFQELITEQMTWQSSAFDGTNVTYASAGKVPAWINYMTDVDRCYGNFAYGQSEDFMVLNRGYQTATDGSIKDLTTYIDPVKYNYIFAQTSRDAMNFWVHIGKKIYARRKMSAKVIPNL